LWIQPSPIAKDKPDRIPGLFADKVLFSHPMTPAYLQADELYATPRRPGDNHLGQLRWPNWHGRS